MDDKTRQTITRCARGIFGAVREFYCPDICPDDITQARGVAKNQIIGMLLGFMSSESISEHEYIVLVKEYKNQVDEEFS